MESLYWINNVEEMQIFKSKVTNVTNVIKEVKNLFENNKEKYITDAINFFSRLFSHENVICIEETQEILYRAQLRRLYKKRPFHYREQEKDSLADAVIVESLIDYTANTLTDDDQLYFISRNIDDFSEDNAKEKLHYEIQESIVSYNIEDRFKYRVHFYKTLIEDFKEESEHAGFLEYLEAERRQEYLNELKVNEIEHYRELVGLPSLSGNWEEIIIENENIESFVNELLELQESIVEQFDYLSDEYFNLIDEIQQSSITEIQQLVENINSNNACQIAITTNVDGMRDAILKIVNERMEINIEDYLSEEMWICEDYFSLNKTLLKYKDFNQNVLTVRIEGELNAENGGQDIINVILNDQILHKNAKGYIEVHYGYINFDEEGHPADGMKEEFYFHLDEVVEAVEKVSEYLVNFIQQNIVTINNIRNSLGI